MNCRYNKPFQNIIKDENGFVYTIMILILLPLLVLLVTSNAEIARVNRSINRMLQTSLDNAVHIAAHMVDEQSQAFANPKIDNIAAIEKFSDVFFSNMSLLETGENQEGSTFENTSIWVLVYNGDDMFTGVGQSEVLPSVLYIHSEGHTTKHINNAHTGFPTTVYVGESGITLTPQAGGRVVEITSPTVVAVVNTYITSVTGTADPQPVTRWSIARIVY